MRVLAAVAVLGVLCSAGAAAAASFTLQEESGKLYLVSGPDRLLVGLNGRFAPGDTLPLSASLPDGYRVEEAPSGELVISQHDREVGRLDYHQIMGDWLKEDALWGGHKQANDLRYLLRTGTQGEFAVLSDLTPVGDSALAVASWRTRGSGLPIAAQYLVRLRVSPRVELEPLRQLDLPWAWHLYLYRAPGPRLFRRGDRLLLYAKPGDLPATRDSNSELVEIGPVGEPRRVVATFPVRFRPEGLLDARWLVLTDITSEARRPVWLVDSETGKRQVLPGDWQSARWGATRAAVPPSGGRIVVTRSVGRAADGSDLREQTFLVRAPSGKGILLRGPRASDVWFWKEYLLSRGEGGELEIRNLSDGKLRQQLKLDR